jgi:membrane-bound lytic murein transglycosylase A
MIKIFIISSFLLLFFGCFDKEEVRFELMPDTPLVLSNISGDDISSLLNLDEILKHFQNNCRYSRVKKIYPLLCEKSLHVKDAKSFFTDNFDRYEVLKDKKHDVSLLTGYFEPLLHGSLTKHKPYLYPLYEPPSDMLHVELGDSYDKLKNMRLRGRLVDGKIVSYYDRESINADDKNMTAICYVDDKIDRFFLEVQGSGRIELDTGKSIFVGYSDQNGHQYRSIGKELIEMGAIKREDISLQSIRKWLKNHPKLRDRVLHINRSFVFFKERSQGATGAMGIELTPMYSVAVDKSFIPLGSLLSIESDSYKSMVFAEDTGGAIKGSVRADLFLGFGDEALKKAGTLKDNLKLYIWLPKNYNGKIQP